MQIERLFYASEVAPAVDATQVRLILGVSRMNNRRADVTGMLAYTGRHFLQVLEGDGAAVERTMRRIAADPRHGAIRTLHREQAAQRRFDAWSMAFVNSPDHADAVAELALAAQPDGAAAVALVAALAARAAE